MRTLIGAIGSSTSSDHTIAARVSERLAADAPIAAARVVVEELGVDAAEVAQRLSGEWPRFERVILVGAVTRNRPAGTVAAYLWDGAVHDEHADATTATGDGSASFDSTLLLVRRLADLPDEVIVVEVEPDAGELHANASLSAISEAAVDRAHVLVRRLATNGRAAANLPRSTLGGLARISLAD